MVILRLRIHILKIPIRVAQKVRKKTPFFWKKKNTKKKSSKKKKFACTYS